MTERERVIAMTEEEAHDWIFSVPVNSKEFWRRHNFVNFDCGLTRADFDVTRPIKSGELVCTAD